MKTLNYQSINPINNELIRTYETFTNEILLQKLVLADSAFQNWNRTEFNHIKELLLTLSQILISNKKFYAELITLEMGKIISEAVAEVEKCATLCQYYAENGERILQDEIILSDHKKSFVSYEPLGIVYIIMPWNFPFWQVFRCAIPAIMAGNVIVLKHAENVPQCAEAIENSFREAGFQQGVFTNLFISHKQSNSVIEYESVRGVSLTGSERAGSSVAEHAGKHIKKVVLELGGSDPFIVFKDADIEKAVETGIKSRYQNAGQSCIAAKRFILHRSISQKFIQLFLSKVKSLKVGNPMDKETNIGPLARTDLVDTLDEQVRKTLEMGAEILIGGNKVASLGNYYEPTILSGIPKDSPAYTEELFGPVASLFVVDNDDEAISLANDTQFGLGASLWTNNIEKGIRLAKKIQSGNVFINYIVKSDARLPFGGIKHSGYGRELSEIGMKEFVNIKTICID